MKKDVHPTYYPKAEIKCACGAVLEAGSTVEKIEVEICSQCHPYFTGDKKVVDTAGRMERFQQITQKAKEVQKKLRGKKKKSSGKSKSSIKKSDKKTLKSIKKK